MPLVRIRTTRGNFNVKCRLGPARGGFFCAAAGVSDRDITCHSPLMGKGSAVRRDHHANRPSSRNKNRVTKSDRLPIGKGQSSDLTGGPCLFDVLNACGTSVTVITWNS